MGCQFQIFSEGELVDAHEIDLDMDQKHRVDQCLERILDKPRTWVLVQIKAGRVTVNDTECKASTPLQNSESIELLRALEHGMVLGTILLEGDSISVDIREDYARAKVLMMTDEVRKLY